jgi:hypothetical protein
LKNQIAVATAARLFFLTAVAISIATRPFKFSEMLVSIATRSFVSSIHSLDWYQVGVVPAHSIKSCVGQAVRQVVFADVLISGRLGIDGQSFAPIGLHKTDNVSDWLLIKHHCIGIGTKGLPGVQLQNDSDYISYRCDFSIYRKEDVNFRQHF